MKASAKHEVTHGEPGDPLPELRARPPEHRRAVEAGAVARPGVAAKTVMAPAFVTPMQAAELLGIGKNEMYGLIAAGEIGVLRLGRLIRIPREELERLAASSQASDT